MWKKYVMISFHISLHVVHNTSPLQCTELEVLLTKNENKSLNPKTQTKIINYCSSKGCLSQTFMQLQHLKILIYKTYFSFWPNFRAELTLIFARSFFQIAIFWLLVNTFYNPSNFNNVDIINNFCENNFNKHIFCVTFLQCIPGQVV